MYNSAMYSYQSTDNTPATFIAIVSICIYPSLPKRHQISNDRSQKINQITPAANRIYDNEVVKESQTRKQNGKGPESVPEKPQNKNKKKKKENNENRP
jgi:hypothetical protein